MRITKRVEMRKTALKKRAKLSTRYIPLKAETGSPSCQSRRAPVPTTAATLKPSIHPRRSGTAKERIRTMIAMVHRNTSGKAWRVSAPGLKAAVIGSPLWQGREGRGRPPLDHLASFIQVGDYLFHRRLHRSEKWGRIQPNPETQNDDGNRSEERRVG